MKILKIIMLINLIFVCNSCTESNKIFMQMNEDIRNGKSFTAEELLEKATFFTQERSYYNATLTITIDIIPSCEKVNDHACLRKANALLCKIHQDKVDPNEEAGRGLNRFYSLNQARAACKKAGIKIQQGS